MACQTLGTQCERSENTLLLKGLGETTTHTPTASYQRYKYSGTKLFLHLANCAHSTLHLHAGPVIRTASPCYWSHHTFISGQAQATFHTQSSTHASFITPCAILLLSFVILAKIGRKCVCVFYKHQNLLQRFLCLFKPCKRKNRTEGKGGGNFRQPQHTHTHTFCPWDSPFPFPTILSCFIKWTEIVPELKNPYPRKRNWRKWECQLYNRREKRPNNDVQNN